jgi:hypothetical protein
MDEEGQQIEARARALIDQYGSEAEAIAAGHAETVLDQGDTLAFEMWTLVMAAIREQQGGKQIAC